MEEEKKLAPLPFWLPSALMVSVFFAHLIGQYVNWLHVAMIVLQLGIGFAAVELAFLAGPEMLRSQDRGTQATVFYMVSVGLVSFVWGGLEGLSLLGLFDRTS